MTCDLRCNPGLKEPCSLDLQLCEDSPFYKTQTQYIHKASGLSSPWATSLRPKKKKEQASREELNHMFQNKEQSSQQTKYSKCCKGFTPLLVERQNDCIIVLRISDGPVGWIGIIAVPGSWRQTQLPTCSKVGSRSWGVSMITHYNLRILPHSVIKRTVSVLRERGLLWHEFLQKAPGIKFADGNNSASVRLFFKSVVAAIKLCKDAFGRS